MLLPLLIDMKGKCDEGHDGRDTCQHREDEEGAPPGPIRASGGLRCVRARAPRSPSERLLFLEPVELFPTRGALADMSFDCRQLGQADLAFAEEEEALASVLAFHGRNHLLSPGAVAVSTTV
jgi:hypothetical protein